MNGKEDFGPLVDALVACVGAMDVFSVVAVVYNLASYGNISMDINNNDVKAMQDKNRLVETHDILSRSKDSEIPILVVDTTKDDGDVINTLVTKVNELTDKVTELVVRSRENSMERFLDTERERYRRSQSPSPPDYNESNSGTFLEQEDDDEHEKEGKSHGDTENDNHLSKGITRDDEFRKTLKRSSQVSSQHETREEELARLTEIEAEEMNNMDDYVPLTYQSDENDDKAIGTIEEMPTCPIHGKLEEILASGSAEKSLDENVKNTEILSDDDAKSHDGNKIKEKLDVNENFIKMERAALQQQSSIARMLVKQGNVGSEDCPEESVTEIIPQKHENLMTEPKTVENVLTQANVEKLPRLENFPKSLETASPTNEATSELISNLEDSQHVDSTAIIEDLPTANTDSPMVRSYAEVLTSNDIIDENVTELQIDDQLPIVEVISEPQSVIGSLMEVNVNPRSNFQNYSLGSTATPSLSSYSNMNLNTSMSSLQNKSENISLASSAFDNDYAIRRRTPEPDVSISISKHDGDDEMSIENELLNINSPTSSGEGLKRTKRCINSLDRSASRSSSRLSHSRKSKSPSVASQEDYKDWFDKFDNHLSPELTVPENIDDDEIFDSDLEEELLMDAEGGNLDGADICNIGDEDDKGNGDVSVHVTLNLKQKSVVKKEGEEKEEEPCNPCKEYQQEKNIYKTKGEELEEMQRLWETKKRRTSILPSTEEQQKNYVSILHPEEFPDRKHMEAFDGSKREPHEHHQHMHNVGYNEWMKKIVDHHSCHLALSDSDSDSDVPLDEVQMLPLFCDEKLKKRRKKK